MALTETEGSYQDFAYTGGMQSVTIPKAGVYKMEVWGAGGGNHNAGHAGGAGGYAVGYKLFAKGETVYVCVGQSLSGQSASTAYNGGGNSIVAHYDAGCAGGGCTHMATASGELKSLAGNPGTVLIVGAGGSGAGRNFSGLQGGGTTGEGGVTTDDTEGAGGTQVGGGWPGRSDIANDGTYGAFGQGGTGCGWTNNSDITSPTTGSGGGGGWYGGGGGGCNSWSGCAGGGGSSYIGGVAAFTHLGTNYAPSTTLGGGKAGGVSGEARITFIKADVLPVVFNGTVLQRIVHNGTEVMRLIYDGLTLFMRKVKRCCRFMGGRLHSCAGTRARWQSAAGMGETMITARISSGMERVYSMEVKA